MTDAQENQQAMPDQSVSDEVMKTKRKKFLTLFAVILIISGILYAIWAIFFSPFRQH